MKGLAILFLCIVAAQARSTAVQKDSRAVAELGENPWLVHLRIAVSTSGFLNSCAGSLIDSTWVLTANDCVANARFIWIRYGVVNVVNPELVTEASISRTNPGANIALININRAVHPTANIAPVALASSADEVESASLCVFGEQDGSPGETLECFTVELSLDEDNYVATSEDGQATRFDLGAPLVVDGEQIGVLTGITEEGAAFRTIASVEQWIQENKQ